MDWLYKFPQMSDASLSLLRKVIDDNFRAFTRAYGSALEAVFYPLQQCLIMIERLFLGAPWPVMLLIILAIAWFAGRSWKIVVGTLLIFTAIGYFGMWQDTMRTFSMIVASTLFAILIGIPLGIAMAWYDGLQKTVNPVLDVMQTMPPFVYLIPIVMLLGIGRVPGLLAVIIYALPPIIRLTNLGIRLVDRDVLEAADAFGSSPWRKLIDVQLPLALPTIMAGINQTIMMALAMVVIASMIGVQGLGQPVLRAISNQYFTLGVFNGLAIVGIAVVLDRVSQAYGQRLQKHRAEKHD